MEFAKLTTNYYDEMVKQVLMVEVAILTKIAKGGIS
jgi:hypothetical protein